MTWDAAGWVSIVVVVASLAVTLLALPWLGWVMEIRGRRQQDKAHTAELRRQAERYEAKLIRLEGEVLVARTELAEALEGPPPAKCSRERRTGVRA